MLIKNIRVIDYKANIDQVLDILIQEDKIVLMQEHIDCEEKEIIDGTGLIAAPGLVDVHVHFRDPGLTYKEDITTGAAAAAAGGYTSVVCMANTKPVVDNKETLQEILQKGKETPIHVYQVAAVTMGLKGEKLTDMEGLKAAGAAGFTDDGMPILDELVVKKALHMAAKLDVPISFHEENPALIHNNGIHEGRISMQLGILGAPAEAEADFIQRDLQLAKDTGAHINIQHISSAKGVELVRQAKKENSCVHAEAAPHHFTLTEEAVLEFGTLAKMNPPLRTEKDRQAVIRGLADGTIDMIATDHAPHSKEEKEKELLNAPSGIIGLETALALGITYLVKPGELTMMQLVEKMSYRPAMLYHMNAGYLEANGPADLVLFDAEETWKPEGFVSKSSNSPFLGKTLQGRVKYTICSGKLVYGERG